MYLLKLFTAETKLISVIEGYIGLKQTTVCMFRPCNVVNTAYHSII